MSVRAEGGKTLGNAVIIVIAEHIQPDLGAGQQSVRGAGPDHTADPRAHLTTHRPQSGVSGGTRSHKQAVRGVFPNPTAENVLVCGVIGRRVAGGRTGHFHHIWLIHELGGGDRHAVFPG